MTAFDAFTAAVQAHRPRVAVVLGSGLGSVPQRFVEAAAVPFGEVPGLVAPSVHGHSGKISLGQCGGVSLLVFRGRLHFYEGHSWDQVAAPVRLMANWGVKTLFLTNAAGGIHDRLWPGDLMLLSDHLWLQFPTRIAELHSQIGSSKPEPEAEARATMGITKSPSPSRPLRAPAPRAVYSPRLIELLQQAEPDRELLAGVYAALTGPCYETPAEIRALKAMGADAVGMSTAFEARTAVELGMEVAAISCITNKAAGLAAGTLDHKEVLANAGRPAERISNLLETILPKLGYS
ncbi:MAG TPA: purine-nucleoside phosphorylase [Gemmataceae bacterium]|jgi:purine-nucleoside phosphorylase|nr:purine-nucleoside phosphorylase [Gemmataceae bacterium]